MDDGDRDDPPALERRMTGPQRAAARRVLDLCRARGLKLVTAESYRGWAEAAISVVAAG